MARKKMNRAPLRREEGKIVSNDGDTYFGRAMSKAYWPIEDPTLALYAAGIGLYAYKRATNTEDNIICLVGVYCGEETF